MNLIQNYRKSAYFKILIFLVSICILGFLIVFWTFYFGFGRLVISEGDMPDLIIINEMRRIECKNECNIRLNVGEYRVRFIKSGFFDINKIIIIDNFQDKNLVLEFEKRPKIEHVIQFDKLQNINLDNLNLNLLDTISNWDFLELCNSIQFSYDFTHFFCRQNQSLYFWDETQNLYMKFRDLKTDNIQLGTIIDNIFIFFEDDVLNFLNLHTYDLKQLRFFNLKNVYLYLLSDYILFSDDNFNFLIDLYSLEKKDILKDVKINNLLYLKNKFIFQNDNEETYIYDIKQDIIYHTNVQFLDNLFFYDDNFYYIQDGKLYDINNNILLQDDNMQNIKEIFMFEDKPFFQQEDNIYKVIFHN